MAIREKKDRIVGVNFYGLVEPFQPDQALLSSLSGVIRSFLSGRALAWPEWPGGLLEYN